MIFPILCSLFQLAVIHVGVRDGLDQEYKGNVFAHISVQQWNRADHNAIPIAY